MPNNASH